MPSATWLPAPSRCDSIAVHGVVAQGWEGGPANQVRHRVGSLLSCCMPRYSSSPTHPPTHQPTLAQVETQLRQVNAQFARLNDTSGAHVLDLYGRTAAMPRADEPQQQAALQRKASKRIPISETTRALIRQAHSKLPREMLGGSLPGSQAASQPSSPPVGGSRGGLGAFGTPSVSFDRAIQGARGAAGRPAAAAQPAGSRPGTTQGPGGVLRIPEESDERAQRLLPYRCAHVQPAAACGLGAAVKVAIPSASGCCAF